MPERSILRLSDAYTHTSDNPALELIVQILNINVGYNQELMEKCKMLCDYTIFVNKTREYGGTLPFPKAVEQAIEDCISEGVLKEFLQKNRAEVLSKSWPEAFQQSKLPMRWSKSPPVCRSLFP